jgi:lambda repressor-like predicted transcriptional regulator
MGKQSLQQNYVDEAVSAILSSSMEDRTFSLRELSRKSGVKLTRLGDVLRRGKPMTIGELEDIAAALGLVPWKVLRQAETREEQNLTVEDHDYVSVPDSSLDPRYYDVAAYDPGIDIEAEQEGMMEEP